MNIKQLKEFIRAEVKALREEEAQMKPKILDISPEQDAINKQAAIYDEPNNGETEYYTGMQGKR